MEEGTTNFGVNKAGFMLHSAIHAARPDIKCVVHLHTPNIVAVSTGYICIFMAPMIYTASCVMLLMRAAFISRASGRGLGPWKSRVFGPCEMASRPPPTCPCNGCCPHRKHYTQGRINHRCIDGFKYKSP